ncbi:MAG: hypothetical protein K9K37_09325 [Desulfocapsa sp.]|nr:hypothetical protein [Desulfocapsa sp.]
MNYENLQETLVKKQTKVQCRIISINDYDALAGISTIIASLGPDTPLVFSPTSDRIFVYSMIHDYLGNPLWILEVDAPRPISSQSRSMLRYVLFSNIFIGFGTLLLLLVLYRNRLRMATSTFRDLIGDRMPSRSNEQASHRLSLGFDTDEISRLSDDLRVMIESFEQTREEQKNIIDNFSTSRSKLNDQMVKEIKERLQIESDLQEIKKDLEELVAIRTEELQQSNAALQDEIEIRKENENELISHRQRLRALSSELIQTENRERRQLAQALHDQIGQSLSAVKMYMDSLISSVSESKTNEKLKCIVGIIDKTIQDVRSLTFELSPPILYELGIEAALDWLAEDFYKKYSLEITSTCESCPQCSPPAFRAMIFRTVRELLINIVRHANADKAEVDVSCTGNGVRITVTDDGCGMKNELVKDTKNNVGFGLFSIRERAGNLGGKMVILSEVDKGTTIIVTLPYKEIPSEPNRLVL